MRIATYNVEWFDALFDEGGQLLDDDEWSGRYNVTRGDQAWALRDVFRALDADIILVVEAPDHKPKRPSTKCLEHFAKFAGIRATTAEIGFPNQTQQELVVLFDPKVVKLRHEPVGHQSGKAGSADAPRFDTVFRWDLDNDQRGDPVRWSKPPLELIVKHRSGFEFRMIGVHAKSKAPHGAKNEVEMMRRAVENRKKQLAQCVWLRQRVEQHLKMHEDLIVLGDFNDGPGLDPYEEALGKSGVEIVAGQDGEAKLFDPSLLMGATMTTSRFKLKGDDYLEALLDFLLVSPDFLDRKPFWRVWHPLRDPEINANKRLRDALLLASDHFPVTLDCEIDLGKKSPV